MKSNVSLLDKVTQFIVTTKGKQMRPMFVFLCANLVGEVTEKPTVGFYDRTYSYGNSWYMTMWWTNLLNAVIFLHQCALENKIAVLVGDYLLSKSVLLSTDNKDFDLPSSNLQNNMEMAEGELLQLEKARKLDITEDVYYEIIRQKTATLIAACLRSRSPFQ